jgi:plasmid stabilization system protein ParE
MASERYRFTSRARRDLESILLASERRFGSSQRQRYEDLIHRSAGIVAADPECVGSKPRDEFMRGARSFHLDRAAHRRGGSAHVLYYVASKLEDGRSGVTILRILHDHMDPARHLGDRNPR